MSSLKRPHPENIANEPNSKKHRFEELITEIPTFNPLLTQMTTTTQMTIGTQTETKTIDSPIYIGHIQPWECWCGDRCLKCNYGWCGLTFEVTWTQGAGPKPNQVKKEYCSEMCQKCTRELVERDTNIPHSMLKFYQEWGLID
jgi:hypothetical protein